MPVHTNTIGAQSFNDIIGNLQPRAEVLDVISRKGKDDVQIRLTATKGRPIRIRTVKFVANWAAAKTAIETYAALKDGTSYAITQHSQAFGNFKILDVIQVSARAVEGVVGGLAGSETVRQVCEWTVINVT